MGVKYQDYYATLGVSKDATAKEIQAAFRKLARKFHPDVNKDPGAEARFKQINEAYEVLRDPEKRAKYDQLGANWQAGQDFTPPWAEYAGNYYTGDKGAMEFHFSTGGGFSDFFEVLFGRGAGGFGGFAAGRAEPRGEWSRPGEDREAILTITLEEAFAGAAKTIELQAMEMQPDGRLQQVQKQYEIKIPKGTLEGSKIRLRGQGRPGTGGGPPGDLYLKVKFAPHPVFRVERADLETEVAISPWEAMLGTRLEVPTMEGKVQMHLPGGTQPGQRFRLKGKGIPHKTGTGDLYVKIKVTIPKTLTPEEKALVERLQELTASRPGNEQGGAAYA